jgi:uncharacterized protein
MRVDKGVGHPYNWEVVLEEVTLGNRNAMKGLSTHVDLGGLLRSGGELQVREAVELPDFASYRFAAPAVVSLAIRRIGRGIGLRGSLEVEALGECARCLDEVRLPVALEVYENLEPDAELQDPLGESNVLLGDELDLADLVRQLIDSALPYVLLCNETCGGLCTTCGFKRDGTCRCPHPE